LKARQDGIEIDLELEDTKGPVLQGIDGLSPKGESLGNASYYYSKPRLKSDGLIMLDGEQIPVTGWSWMDHEFSTSVLAQDTVGWDWYAIQLDDGSELMIFILNKDDGGIDDYSSGAIIYPDGSTKRLLINDFQVRSVGEWYSDLSSTKYPSGWNIQVPSEAINILVTPKLVDQELNLSFVYWEGAVSVTGTQSGRSVSGQGYVELTGYAHTMRGRF
jgi:predicted secreted hydrolase